MKLLVIGDDKLGRKAFWTLRESGALTGVDAALNRSSDPRRVMRLIRRGGIPFGCAAAMAWAEARRPAQPRPDLPEVRTNPDLQALLQVTTYEAVYLFRAGVIVNADTLAFGVPFRNLHCAKIPEYAGLCSLWRALRDEAFDQEASLHAITTTIDDPSTLFATEPFRLDPGRSYRENENLAYDVGARLLARELSRNLSMTLRHPSSTVSPLCQ